MLFCSATGYKCNLLYNFLYITDVHRQMYHLLLRGILGKDYIQQFSGWDFWAMNYNIHASSNWAEAELKRQILISAPRKKDSSLLGYNRGIEQATSV